MTGIFDKLFGKKKTVQPQQPPKPSTIETAPLKLDADLLGSNGEPATIPVQRLHSPTRRIEFPQFSVGIGQSVGKQRDHNEDSLFCLTATLSSGEVPMPCGLYIIADGMGGHQHGEIASNVSVRSMANHVIQKLVLPHFSLNGERVEESYQEIMQTGVMEAHQAILRDAQGGGTTLTAVLIVGDRMTITHVGDSRAYIIYADGRMEILTHDHSLVKRLEELGQITAEEAAIHPQRNVLYRALGQGEPFEPDINSLPFPRGGCLLLCSDGLWGVVPERELFNIVTTNPDLQQACQLLVDAANTAGGPDNISVIMVRLPD